MFDFETETHCKLLSTWGLQQMHAGPWEREGSDSVIPNWLHFRRLIYSPHWDVWICSILCLLWLLEMRIIAIWCSWAGSLHFWLALKTIWCYKKDFKNAALWVLVTKPSLCFLCLLLQLPNVYFVGTWTVAGSSNGCARQFVNSRSWVRGDSVCGVQESLCLSMLEITKLLVVQTLSLECVSWIHLSVLPFSDSLVSLWHLLQLLVENVIPR